MTALSQIMFLLLATINIAQESNNELSLVGLSSQYYEHETVGFIIILKNNTDKVMYYDPLQISNCAVRLYGEEGRIHGGVEGGECEDLIRRIPILPGEQRQVARSLKLYGKDIAHRIYKRYLKPGRYQLEIEVNVERERTLRKLKRRATFEIIKQKPEAIRRIVDVLSIVESWEEDVEMAFNRVHEHARRSYRDQSTSYVAIYEYAYELYKHSRLQSGKKVAFLNEMLNRCGGSYSSLMAYLTLSIGSKTGKAEDDNIYDACIADVKRTRRGADEMLDVYRRYIDSTHKNTSKVNE